MLRSDEQQKQYQCLCIALQAVNETCKQRNDIKYSSGSNCGDAFLTDVQKLECKFAQIVDIEKGGKYATALVILNGARGPEILFASNSRKASELEIARSFLSELIEHVGRNPDKYAPKALQKQVLSRILEFNFPRLEVYLNELSNALEACIDSCENLQESEKSNVLAQLRALRDRVQFPHNLTSSTGAKLKFFRNCEDLFKAIQKSQADEIDNIIDHQVANNEPKISYHWSQLRHYLGRLHSFRQASEAIINASSRWPGLFKDITVSYISSSGLQKFTHSRELLTAPMEIIQHAFPKYDLSYYQSDIEDLRTHGLYDQIKKQKQEFPSKTQVHCEVNLHNHLVKIGKTRPCDFWNDAMFIATSKPPCRLCYYYFQDGDNEYQVQPSHMNLYPKWQLPAVADPTDGASTEKRDELMEDILDHMQVDTLKILQKKLPQWKRNDSRTDSRNWPGSARDGADSRTPVSGYHMYSQPDNIDDDSYIDMGTESVGVAVS
ncbi:hypothetical protein NW762_012494 [Fusarium torreyae]|uniref:Uncharacterized protein n=1 Tax=Fusarium torreyae TaxID=1237075 RepID=A0A9W8RMM1_9HYPO|nr:hypothetical protein NW762_012494 [Fusarium torreyae]